MASDVLKTEREIQNQILDETNSALQVNVVAGGTSGTQYNEDDAHTTGDKGTLALVVRKDSAASIAGADGDYTALQVNSTGELRVTGGGGGTQYAVDDALGATPTTTLAGAKRDDALSALTPIEGDAVELRVDSTGALWVRESQAKAATTDNIGAAAMTNQLMDGTTSLTPKFAAISASSSGDNTLVAAVSGKKIRVISCMLIASAAVTVRFEDGAGGTALTGQMDLAANAGAVMPQAELGWFEGSSNTLLNLELSSAVQVSGCLVYVEV